MTQGQGIQWLKTGLQVQTPEHSKNWSNVHPRLEAPIPLVDCKSEVEKGLMRLEASE